MFDKVSDETLLLLVVDHCADGHPYDEIVAGRTRAVLGSTRSTVLCFVLFLISEIEERAESRVCKETNTAASSAVAAVRATTGIVLLATKADRASSTVTRLDVDDRLVDEFDFLAFCDS